MSIDETTGEWRGEPGSAPDGVFDPRWGHPEPDPDHHAKPARYIVLDATGRRIETDDPDAGEVLADRGPDDA